MKIITVCFALLFCGSAYSQALKDTLFFSNGSVIVGKLESVKLGVVLFDPDDANDITVQLRRLKTISANRKIFRIETVAEEVHFGTMLAHPDMNKVYVATSLDTLIINVEDISVLYAFDQTIAERFSGSVGLGYTYTKSSGFGRLNFDAKIKYTSKKAELSLATLGIYTIYDSLLSREKEEVSIKYNYYFIRKWFATAFVVYQRNLELGLERRYQEGLGIGNKFITSKHVYSWARSGVVINQERGTDDINSGVLTELFGQLEINFFRFAKPKINVLLAENFYYSLSQTGRFRNDGSLNVTWEIFKDFNLSLEPYNNYDSKPPISGGDKFDFGIVFGINYKFY
ncbi:DUF481 domain-containing protein [Flavitalea sp.]|nr:DUF481 domain-containing protein [Flavitalea sp.]